MVGAGPAFNAFTKCSVKREGRREQCKKAMGNGASTLYKMQRNQNGSKNKAAAAAHQYPSHSTSMCDN